jgi:hypothetical protein
MGETYKNEHGIKHACSIFQNSEQQFAQVVPFVIEGLKSNKKCVYVYDENSLETIIQELKKSEAQIDTYISTSQLQLLPSNESYLKDGYFNMDVMLNLIADIETSAIRDGYGGVRGLAEMTWILKDALACDKLIEYESTLNKRFENSAIELMCQYNEGRFNHELLASIIRTHHSIYIYGDLYENKYFYTPPEYFKKDMPALPTHSYHAIIETIMEG